MADRPKKSPPEDTAKAEARAEGIPVTIPTGGRIVQREEIYPEVDPPDQNWNVSAASAPISFKAYFTRVGVLTIAALLIVDIGFPMLEAYMWEKPPAAPQHAAPSAPAPLNERLRATVRMDSGAMLKLSMRGGELVKEITPPDAAPMPRRAAPPPVPAEAARVKAPAPPAPAKVSAPNFSGWFVQLVAAPTEESAAALAEKLRREAVTAEIEPALVKGKHYWRVLAGPRPSRAEAEVLAAGLRKLPFAGRDLFVKRVP